MVDTNILERLNSLRITLRVIDDFLNVIEVDEDTNADVSCWLEDVERHTDYLLKYVSKRAEEQGCFERE